MTTGIQTPVGRAPVIPVLVLGIGTYLAWFAVHYWGSDTRWPSDPVKNVLQGNPLPVPTGKTSASQVATTIEQNNAASGGVTPATGSVAAGGSVNGQKIAQAALKYVGAGYRWGGNASAPGNWDCSSFVSYVLGNDMLMKLPGGGTFGSAGYPPGSHGPTTNQYLLFGQPVNLSQAQPGDLVVSTVHMGIVIGNGKMISAQDPQLGTGIAGYLSGFPGGTPFVRRVA